MKKIILVLVFFSFLKLDAFATDACDRLVPQQANFVWKVILNSNLRDYPCIIKSNVLWVSKLWDNYEIISKVDGWYQVKLNNWEIYRIWEKAITKTDEVFIEKSNYELSSKDKRLVSSFVYKVNKIVQSKWISYKHLIIERIWEILGKGNYSLRLTNILQEIQNRVSNIELDLEIEDEEDISQVENQNLENIDINKVRKAWLSWYNWARRDLWKENYTYDSRLDATALEWSQISNSRWDITHKRNTWDSYYDYNIITSWFKDRWVVCENIYRVTHSENIGWWTYSCNDWECTDELIDAIKSTFNFYMWEKNTSYTAHYDSIINSYFTKIWLWIDIEENSKWYFQYYLTVHYCTELL